MTTISLEKLSNGKTLRLTARQDGRTVGVAAGNLEDGKRLVTQGLRRYCSEHRRADGAYDMRFISLNPYAKDLLPEVARPEVREDGAGGFFVAAILDNV